MRYRNRSVVLFLVMFCCGVLHAQRLVFAHYMLANGDYQADDDGSPGDLRIAAYQREIREAQARGIDGFALNAGGWFKEPYYIRRASEMFEAAYRLDSGFHLIFSADMCCGNRLEDVEDMMRRFANSKRYERVYFRRDGRAVLTTFSGQNLGPAFWRQLRSNLEDGSNPSVRVAANALSYVSDAPSNSPLPLFLVPAFFWGGELPDASDIGGGLTTYSRLLDGGFYWGIAAVPGLGVTPDQLPSSHAYAAALHSAGMLYMAPICFQFWGSNADRYYEYSGYSGMRRMWMDAIQSTHPDWIEIITWNDFIEGTYVSPIDDPNRYPNADFLDASGVPTGTLNNFHTHRGATDLLQFFIRWYKDGKQPVISRDAIYWAYRTQPWKAQTSIPAVTRVFGPVADRIYITTNLTAPASLHVISGKHHQTIQLPEGSSDTEVPLYLGDPPRFELFRHKRAVISGEGVDPVESSPRFRNLYYSTGSVSEP